MPLLPPKYFTLDEALAEIKKVLPDEDPLLNLKQAVHDERVKASILADDGQRFVVPHEPWGANDVKFRQIVNTRLGTAEFKHAFRDSTGYGDDWRTVKGELQIERIVQTLK